MKKKSVRKNQPKDAKHSKTLVLGRARNAHGTRVCRAVTCTKCGSRDYASVRRHNREKVYCRPCARRELNAHESGIKTHRAGVLQACSLCKVEFELGTAIKKDAGEVLCFDCLSGFEVWRGSLKMAPDQRQQGQIERRKNGVLLRKSKKIHEAV